MNIHVLQHVPFEGLAGIEHALAELDSTVSVTRLFANETLPTSTEFDLLIILGGPMSVNDVAEFPWLQEEIAFIRNRVVADKPTLGICLGAQLIAKSLGASVYPNPRKEIGWFPVRAAHHKKEEYAGSLFQFPRSVDVLHWHGETFDLPVGAKLLATNDVCQHQAFQYGNYVLGLQFHLETNQESLKLLVANCGDELAEVDQPFIQNEAKILSAEASRYAQINSLMRKVIQFLLAK